ncbi:MAG: thioredoxin-like domain-containing protein [Bacteroidota bacterium]
MRLFKKPILSLGWCIIFLLGMAWSTSSSLYAQKASDKIPNISPDEFTSKSGEMGWGTGMMVENTIFNDVFNKKLNLYQLLEKPVLIELWSLDCQQCKKNKKYLKSFYTQYDIHIISISDDNYPNEIRKQAKQLALPWSMIHDDSKNFEQASFADRNQLGNAKFILITPDKRIHSIYQSEREIGKVGVALQQYFANR